MHEHPLSPPPKQSWRKKVCTDTGPTAVNGKLDTVAIRWMWLRSSVGLCLECPQGASNAPGTAASLLVLHHPHCLCGCNGKKQRSRARPEWRLIQYLTETGKLLFVLVHWQLPLRYAHTSAHLSLLESTTWVRLSGSLADHTDWARGVTDHTAGVSGVHIYRQRSAWRRSWDSLNAASSSNDNEVEERAK